jgi:3',5'-cyclic AMP phosphodiesterase CpdA
MAATTLCCMVLVLPTVLEARKPSRRTARIRRERREVLIYADNRTANEALFRFAVVGDNHYWQSTSRRAAFMATSDARDLRDGLLVGDSPQVLQTMVGQLKTFASSGGSFAVHIGDTQCGGSSFSQTRAEYEQALKRVAAIERAELGRWPVLHIPGNHDLDPFGGGLQACASGSAARTHETRADPCYVRLTRPGAVCCGGRWRGVFRNATARQEEPWQGPAGASYGVVRRAGWRLLMLDSMDSLPSDTDGHGHIGQAQLRWMQLQLAAAADAGESVMLLMHQLLVEPQDAEGELPPFLDLRQARPRLGLASASPRPRLDRRTSPRPRLASPWHDLHPPSPALP